MNTSDLQKLKPVYIHEADYSSDNEVSLVDLATILIKHKMTVIIIFIVTCAIGITMALLTPRIYTFSTTIEIGSQVINGSIQPFESPQALVAKLQYSYIPQILTEYKQSSPDNTQRYQIKASVPKGSNITLLESRGTSDQENTIKTLLQKVSQKAVQDHKRLFISVDTELKIRLEQATNSLNSADNKSDTTPNLVELLTLQLANLRNTREILPPIRSLDPTGGSRKVIVVVSVIAGLFLGIFVAFFAEFWAKIKQKTAANKN